MILSEVQAVPWDQRREGKGRMRDDIISPSSNPDEERLFLKRGQTNAIVCDKACYCCSFLVTLTVRLCLLKWNSTETGSLRHLEFHGLYLQWLSTGVRTKSQPLGMLCGPFLAFPDSLATPSPISASSHGSKPAASHHILPWDM